MQKDSMEPLRFLVGLLPLYLKQRLEALFAQVIRFMPSDNMFPLFIFFLY